MEAIAVLTVSVEVAPHENRPDEMVHLRAALAVVVLAGLGAELAGYREWFVALLQALVVVGIIVTSGLDVRAARRRRTSTP